MPFMNIGEKRPTMHDVARLAGVSVGTASAIVNGHTTIRPKLRKRIDEVVRALNFHPNQTARSLKLQRTRTFGMVVPDVANPFITGVVRGVEMEGKRRGYSVNLCNTNGDLQQERRQSSGCVTSARMRTPTRRKWETIRSSINQMGKGICERHRRSG
jgi:Bacterial regulatory proteins, lacI family